MPGVAQAPRIDATPRSAAIAFEQAGSITKPRANQEAAATALSAVELPSGTPAWITPELVAYTLQVWQPRCAKTLSIEDAIDMIRSVARLSDALASIRQS